MDYQMSFVCMTIVAKGFHYNGLWSFISTSETLKFSKNQMSFINIWPSVNNLYKFYTDTI